MMIAAIDFHAHLGDRWDDVPDVRASAADLAAAGRAAGVVHSVVSSLESLLSGTLLGASDDGRAERRLDAGNAQTLDRVIASDDLSLLAVVDPRREGGLERARELLAHPRVAGVKLHPDRHRYEGGGELARVCALLAEFHGKAVLVHCTGTRWSAPESMIEAARRFPEVPVVLAHLGRTDPPRRVIDAIGRRGAGNVYVDTAAAHDAAMIRAAVETIGAARVLFGSDFPFYAPSGIRALIESAGIGPAELRMILSTNARRLLGLA